MGSSSSTEQKSSLKNYIENNAELRSAISIEMDNAAKADLKIANIQNFKLQVGGKNCCTGMRSRYCDPTAAAVFCDNLTIGQTINAKSNVYIDANQKVSAEIVNSFVAEAQNQVTQALDQLTQGANDKLPFTMELASKKDTNQRTDVENTVKNSIKTSLSTNIVHKNLAQVIQNVYNKQNQTLLICGTLVSDTCDFQQDIGVELQITAIAAMFGEILQNTEVVNQFYTKTDTYMSQTAQGTLASLFSSIWTWIIVGIVLVVTVAIILLVIRYVRKNKKRKSYGTADQHTIDYCAEPGVKDYINNSDYNVNDPSISNEIKLAVENCRQQQYQQQQ